MIETILAGVFIGLAIAEMLMLGLLLQCRLRRQAEERRLRPCVRIQFHTAGPSPAPSHHVIQPDDTICIAVVSQ